jgi:hypothetical protein
VSYNREAILTRLFYFYKSNLTVKSQKIFGHCCNITYLAVTTKNKIVERIDMKIQGVSEISTLILAGNRTHQKEQLFLVVA